MKRTRSILAEVAEQPTQSKWLCVRKITFTDEDLPETEFMRLMKIKQTLRRSTLGLSVGTTERRLNYGPVRMIKNKAFETAIVLFQAAHQTLLTYEIAFEIFQDVYKQNFLAFMQLRADYLQKYCAADLKSIFIMIQDLIPSAKWTNTICVKDVRFYDDFRDYSFDCHVHVISQIPQ